MVSLDTLYYFKKLDFFAQPVRLKIKRSKVGKKADYNIGSWFGVFVSLIVVGGLVLQTYAKYHVMMSFDRTTYSSTLIKNKFEKIKDHDGNIIADSGEIKLTDYNFMPSLQTKIIPSLADFKALEVSEVYDFDSDNNYKFNLEKLSKYIKFYIKILKKGSDVETSTILRSDLVTCTEEMFSTIPEELKVKSVIESRLCPDMESIKDHFVIKNGYSNKKERISFSIQAVLCNAEAGETCAPNGDIDTLLESIYFTMYVLEESIAFGQIENIGSRPISVDDTFHSQFQLNRLRYRDNNNFVQFNDVNAADDIYSYKKPNTYYFMNFIQNPFWDSLTYRKVESVSTDGGQTFIDTTDDLIMGLYFFVYNQRLEHTRKVYNYVDILSEVGGLSTSILAIVGALVVVVNQYVYTIYFLNLLYFVRDQEETGGADEDKVLKETSVEMMGQPQPVQTLTIQTNNSMLENSNNQLVSQSKDLEFEGGDGVQELGTQAQQTGTQAGPYQTGGIQSQSFNQQNYSEVFKQEFGGSSDSAAAQQFAQSFRKRYKIEETFAVKKYKQDQQIRFDNNHALKKKELTQQLQKVRKDSLKQGKEVYPKYSKHPLNGRNDSFGIDLKPSREEETEGGEFSGQPLNGEPKKKKFTHHELGYLDIFANIKYGFWRFIYGTFTSAKGLELKDKAISHMSQTQVMFMKGLENFEDDVCIEQILRYVHKLQSSVAALMLDNMEAQNTAKLMYFSNQIIYKSRINEEQMKIESDFLEYLKSARADSITYNHSSGFGEFNIDMRVRREGDWVQQQEILKVPKNLRLRKLYQEDK